MNTLSHFLMTAALEKSLPRVPIVKSAFLLGSIAPDLPLWILSISSISYYHFIQGWSLADTFNFVFGELYFHNPFWIASHNFLHSLIILLVALSLLWRSRRNIRSRERWLFWFFVACLLHTGVDILTHANDGPLLFFPLEWTIRFHSPISYWDPQYHGREFQIFERVLTIVLLLYLLRSQICRYLRSLIRFYRPNSGVSR
ncbi:MAG TPA: metal-dependent hydrolase [Leptolyngbyaceae cyanobacterium]